MTQIATQKALLLLKQQLHDLHLKCDVLEHSATTLKLEKQEMNKEITKLKQEKNDLHLLVESLNSQNRNLLINQQLLSSSLVSYDLLQYKNTELNSLLKQNKNDFNKVINENELIKKENETLYNQSLSLEDYYLKLKQKEKEIIQKTYNNDIESFINMIQKLNKDKDDLHNKLQKTTKELVILQQNNSNNNDTDTTTTATYTGDYDNNDDEKVSHPAQPLLPIFHQYSQPKVVHTLNSITNINSVLSNRRPSYHKYSSWQSRSTYTHSLPDLVLVDSNTDLSLPRAKSTASSGGKPGIYTIKDTNNPDLDTLSNHSRPSVKINNDNIKADHDDNNKLNLGELCKEHCILKLKLKKQKITIDQLFKQNKLEIIIHQEIQKLWKNEYEKLVKKLENKKYSIQRLQQQNEELNMKISKKSSGCSTMPWFN